ncbi:MAG: DUF1015 family protein [Chitinivibrionales bacterium]|nr:DUF1015 family protein [Chitinivibrionales bacterium]
MAEIRPFRGCRFSLKNPYDLKQHAAPPYDMIDGETRDTLYDLHPHNIIRIIQNKPEPGDTANSDRHARAASILQEWEKDGVLTLDPGPSLYVYRQRYTSGEDGDTPSFERTGIIARVKLVDFREGVILPHENTLSAPKVDRYELLKATRCNTGQIFGIVQDDGDFFSAISTAVTGKPVGNFTDNDSVRHALFKITDPAAINRLVRLAADRIILIADGHHRYETALQFARESGAPAHQYVMMTLVSMADPGLVIRPFHRCLKQQKLLPAHEMLHRLGDYFKVREFKESSIGSVGQFVKSRDYRRMAYLDRATQKVYGLSLNVNGEKYLKENPGGMSYKWNHLDVSMLNSLVIHKILGLPVDGTTLHDIFNYEKNVAVAYARVLEKQDYYGAFFLRPIQIATVRDIVGGNERMPQKSTNFFPKFYSGLVLNSLEVP